MERQARNRCDRSVGIASSSSSSTLALRSWRMSLNKDVQYCMFNANIIKGVEKLNDTPTTYVNELCNYNLIEKRSHLQGIPDKIPNSQFV